ncbi:MAG: hypothetical protein JNM81_17165 [Rhodospirillaceae bacterium]|nr:hypothetical protein [Rhodospirillaceae bacterium]
MNKRDHRSTWHGIMVVAVCGKIEDGGFKILATHLGYDMLGYSACRAGAPCKRLTP